MMMQISVRSGILFSGVIMMASLWSLWALHCRLCGGELLDCRFGQFAINACVFTWFTALGLLSAMDWWLSYRCSMWMAPTMPKGGIEIYCHVP